MERAFQVDLRGIVDLLSHHLYSSPRVYLRELLQNGVDAVTARQAMEPGAMARIVVDPIDGSGRGVFRVHDTGVGLTEDEVHAFLATIGHSSKRDDLGFARQDFLGQFGIGLLSCFLVSDEVRVLTRSARGGPTLEWVGYSDGRYSVRHATAQRQEPGTTVTLVPRHGHEHWLSTATVTELAGRFGNLLPIEVSVASRRITVDEVPWRAPYPSAAARGEALYRYAESVFGFTPFDCIDLAVPEAGLSGIAFVMPFTANPSVRQGHHVYLRRMLLGDNVSTLLPDWAFFIRCVVDTTELRPTASREDLYSDDLLTETRTAIGNRVRDWMIALSVSNPERLRQFLAIHHLGVKALALHDRTMLRLVDEWWPMETNWGPMTLREFRRRSPAIRYTSTADEFRELASVAGAHGIGLINGGYTYDIEIMKQLHVLDSAVRVTQLSYDELTTHFGLPDTASDAAVARLLDTATAVLEPLNCVPVARSFDPPTLPALYMVSREAIRAHEAGAARAAAHGLWAEVLDRVELPSPTSDRPQLVLNVRNPVVGKVLRLTAPELIGLAVQSLYGQALLQGHHPLRAADTALMNDSFAGLLDWAMRAENTR